MYYCSHNNTINKLHRIGFYQYSIRHLNGGTHSLEPFFARAFRHRPPPPPPHMYSKHTYIYRHKTNPTTTHPTSNSDYGVYICLSMHHLKQSVLDMFE